MLKKSITYTDFNGDEVTEDFFFHLSKAELVELELSHEGGLADAMRKIIDTNDGKALVEEFKKIILLSHGKKSSDGKRFIKNSALREEFESTEAYSVLFFELATDADAAVEFMNGIIPPNLAEDVAAIEAKQQAPTPEPRELTMAQATEEFSGKDLTYKIVSGEIVIVDE